MDGGLVAQEMQAYAQLMYPALPPDQALLQYYCDLYNSVPESIRSQLPEIGVALGELFGTERVVFLCRIARILIGVSKSGTTTKRPILIPPVEQNNISFINGSLNWDSRFANAVTCAAFIGAALALKVGNDAISRIGSALDAIREELSIQNIAKVQGWGEDGLGYHIHRLVLMEIENSQNKNGLHLFYVWTPGNTTWHTRFAERCRDLPLGRQFGGYHHDLGTICNLMWSNRRTLVQMLPPGRDATFYLLVPSFDTIAIDDPIIFHESLHPLVVKGDLYRGQPLVWLNPALCRDRLVLQDVGVLPDIGAKIMDTGLKTFAGFWLSGAACAATIVVGGTICPPLLLYEPYLASAFASSCVGGMTSGIGTMGTLAYHDLTMSRPRVLGPPKFVNLDI